MNPTTKQDRSDEDHQKTDDHKTDAAYRGKLRTSEFCLYAAERARTRVTADEEADTEIDSLGAIARLFNVKRTWLTTSMTRCELYLSPDGHRLNPYRGGKFAGYKALADDDPARQILVEYEAACRRVLPFRELVRIAREVPKSTEAIEELYASLNEGERGELRGIVDTYLMAAELAISARKMLEAARLDAEALLARRIADEPLVRNTAVV